jgi:CTP synthase (UTP-ammonia lyase)
MKQAVKIGVIGDFNSEYPSHIATNAAINHAGDALGITVEPQWVPTTTLEIQLASLAQFDALWCSPGSPYRSMAGALQGIRFAREHDWPFIGT